MYRIIKCEKKDYKALVGIWERSVRATHLFLDDNAIDEIKSVLAPCYFPNVDLYGLSDDGLLVGFIGLREDEIEMLFIDSEKRGHGYGSALIEFAKQKGAAKVDVNEQNPLALAFYQAKGFRVIGRDEYDDAGRHYPILHLSLAVDMPGEI